MTATRRPRPVDASLRAIVPFLLFAVAMALVFPRAVSAHMPLPIYLQGKVEESEFTLRLVIGEDLFREWMPLEPTSQLEEESTALESMRPGLEAFVARNVHVKVDRVLVNGVVRAVKRTEYSDHDRLWAYIEIDVAYGTQGSAKEIAIAWRNYNGGLGAIFDQVEAEMEGQGETSYYAFREREPEVIWHAPTARPRLAPPPPWRGADHPAYYVPLGSLALLLMALAAFLGLARRGASLGVRWGTFLAGVTLAVAFSGVALARVPGLGIPADERPLPAEAVSLFETRLRTIYRAFDYDSEDAIYDTLARGVTGELLDDVYVEVYGSLILREEGGAVCKVQKVDVLEATPSFPEHASTFEVRAHWRVHGKVGHWGHTHVRVNEYVAVFTLAHREGTWKIAAMDVRSHERVDDGR